MANAPNNPQLALRQDPIIPHVLLTLDGSSPSWDDETTAFRVLSVRRSAGGKSLDSCLLQYDLAAQKQRIQNWSIVDGMPVSNGTPASGGVGTGGPGQPATANAQVAIIVKGNPKQGTQDQPLFWGEISKRELQLAAGVEESKVTGRVEHYHFGKVARGMQCHNPLAQPGQLQTEILEKEVVFQPVIDGLLYSNQSIQQDDNGAQLWVDAESLITTEGQAFQGTLAADWDLPSAVQSMCSLCNGDESLVKNPGQGELQDQIQNPPALYDLKLPRLKWLPEYLDHLLQPLGFDWCLDYGPNNENDSISQPAIRCFSRSGPGGTSQKQLYLQQPGSQIDLSQTNTETFDLEASIADLANEVNGFGSLEEVEVTLPLFRGWPTSQDQLTAQQLDRNFFAQQDQQASGTLFQQNPDAWRLWVANENGDWVGSRPEITQATVPDLRPLFLTYIAHRRRAFDCLAWDPAAPPDDEKQGKRRHPYLEWCNLMSTGMFSSITGASAGENGQGSFTVNGNFAANIPVNSTVTVFGSSGNNGFYTVQQASFNSAGNTTTVTVVQNVPNAFGGGSLSWSPWAEVPPEWGHQVRREQVGIYFGGEVPPDELMAAGLGAALRLTCVIQGDARVQATAEKDQSSVNTQTVTLDLDMPDRFHKRTQAQPPSPYASIMANPPFAQFGADTRDDTQKLQAFVKLLRPIEDAAAASIKVELFGIHFDYEIGDFVTDLVGRNLDFNCTGDGAPPRYVQVTGIEWKFQEQRTVLEISPAQRMPVEERIRRLPVVAPSAPQ